MGNTFDWCAHCDEPIEYGYEVIKFPSGDYVHPECLKDFVDDWLDQNTIKLGL